MKKKILIFVAVLLVAALAAGGALWYSYASLDEASLPQPSVTVMGRQLQPQAWQWQQPVWGGLLTRSFEGGASPGTQAAPVQLGTLETEQPSLSLVFPQGYETQITLHRGEELVYSGAPAGYTEESIRQNGLYTLDIQCSTPAGAEGGRGVFRYLAAFGVAIPLPEPDPEPALFTGRLELQQGDVLALRLMNLPPEVSPTAETQLGMASFLPMGEGRWDAAVPIGNTRQPGEYTVDVTAGELSWQLTVTVLLFNFDRQDLVIDESDPAISEANSPEAIQQYNNIIIPMRRQADDVRYWEGLFIQPAQGRISTNFGEIRITNGDESTARPHWGMDIANAEGTPIYAPNNGRVAFADYLLAVGWTIIIEHGGGLKSYMFHMNEIFVEVDQMVATGDHIGAMGTTGYSTGVHLHYETRIGDQAISPQMLFDQSAGIYSLDAEPAEVQRQRALWPAGRAA